MNRVSKIQAILVFLILIPATVAAAPCVERSNGLAVGPVTAGLLDGDLGSARRVCMRNEIGVRGSALLLVELDNFFGRISGGLIVDGSWAIRDNLEIFGSVELLRYESLITPISSSTLSFGYTNVGAGWSFLETELLRLGVHGKVVLPTAQPLNGHTHPFGLDAGLALSVNPLPWLQVHAHVGGLFSAAAGYGPAQPRGGASLTAGVELIPVPKFAFVFDINAMFGYTAPLEVLAIAPAIRLSNGKRFGFDIGANVPLAGRERALLTLDLRASVTLGPLPGAAPGPVDP